MRGRGKNDSRSAGWLLIALGGWFAGFSLGLSALWSGQGHALLVAWLVFWTALGAFFFYVLYQLFGHVPESLRLRPTGIAYDSGVPPLQSRRYSRIALKEAWNVYFPKRTRIELDRPQLASLRLLETDSGNRLTLDAGSERREIAPTASAAERQWLFQTLAKRYSLPSAPGGAG